MTTDNERDCPTILYGLDLQDCSSLTASAEDADHPVGHLADWKPWTYWQNTGSSTHTITAVWSVARTLRAWGIWGHNLGSLGGTVTTYWWNGAAWVVWTAAHAATDDNAFYLRDEAISTTSVKWEFTGALSLRIGVLAVGDDLVLPVGMRAGWCPPDLAQRHLIRPQVSRDGTYLGGIVESTSAEITVSLDEVTSAWVLANWVPFIEQCQTQPFLMSWSASWAAALCSGAEFPPCPFVRYGRHSIGFTARAQLTR